MHNKTAHIQDREKRDRSAMASFFLFKDIPHMIETPSRLYFTALPPREEAFDMDPWETLPLSKG